MLFMLLLRCQARSEHSKSPIIILVLMLGVKYLRGRATTIEELQEGEKRLKAKAPAMKRAASASDAPAAKRQAVKPEPGAAKKKPAPARGASNAVLAALRGSPAGLTQDALVAKSKMTIMELAPILNTLTQRRQIQLAKGLDGEILFMLTSAKDIENASKLDESALPTDG